MEVGGNQSLPNVLLEAQNDFVFYEKNRVKNFVLNIMVSTPTSMSSTDRRTVSQAVTANTIVMSSGHGMRALKYSSFEDVEGMSINAMVHGYLFRSGA